MRRCGTRCSVLAAAAVAGLTGTALGGLAAVTAAPVTPTASAGLQIVALGDSYTAGNGAAYPELYAARLRAQGAVVDVWSVACSGARVEDLQSQLDEVPAAVVPCAASSARRWTPAAARSPR